MKYLFRYSNGKEVVHSKIGISNKTLIRESEGSTKVEIYKYEREENSIDGTEERLLHIDTMSIGY